MKKSLVVVLVVLIIAVGLYVFLENSPKKAILQASNVVNKMMVNDDSKGQNTGNLDDNMDSYSEYQLRVEIVSTNTSGESYVVKTKMYKKGDKFLYEIEEMTGPQELPFIPKKNLIVGKDLYTNVEIEGENMWFKASNLDMPTSPDMFNLEVMQEQLVNDENVEKIEDEEIDGEKMKCYYNASGKACLKNGVFAYGEDTDPLSGMKNVVRVSEYKKSVDDAVFDIPNDDEVKNMDDFMAIMMAAITSGSEAGIDINALGDDMINDESVANDSVGNVDENKEE